MDQRLILAVEPARACEAGKWGLSLAHLAYRMGEGPHLFRANGPVSPSGGLMVMDAPHLTEGGEVEGACMEVLRECAARRFTGVVCRFGDGGRPVLEALCRRLARMCAERGVACWVSEGYGLAAPEAQVLISSALSGGSLRRRLEEAGERFGPRLCLWCERASEDFALPSPDGSGTPLSREGLEALRREKGGQTFFSDELCAHYFTYMEGETGHFVLYDDALSLRKKLRLAREEGIETAFLPFAGTEDLLREILA